MAGAWIRLLLLLTITFAIIQPAISDSSLHFNPALLEQQGAENGAVDLSAFENMPQPPGVYRVEVVLNNDIRRRATSLSLCVMVSYSPV